MIKVDSTFKKECGSTLYKGIHKLHVIGALIATFAAIAWGLLDHFIRFDNPNILWFDLSISGASIITLILLKSKKGKRR